MGRPLRNKAGKIVYELWVGNADDFNAFREAWFERLNYHLALNGVDLRVDGRSYEKQGIDLEPTIHLGGAKVIERKAREEEFEPSLDRPDRHQERRDENTRRILRRPEIMLDLITSEKSVFDERNDLGNVSRFIQCDEHVADFTHLGEWHGGFTRRILIGSWD